MGELHSALVGVRFVYVGKAFFHCSFIHGIVFFESVVVQTQRPYPWWYHAKLVSNAKG